MAVTIGMPPVVSVFEGEDVELQCKARYANGTLILPLGGGLHVIAMKCTFVVNMVENMSAVIITKSSGVASFKNKTVKFNPDNGNLTILNIGLSDEAVFQCTVLGVFGSQSNVTHLKVKKGKCYLGKCNLLKEPSNKLITLFYNYNMMLNKNPLIQQVWLIL